MFVSKHLVEKPLESHDLFFWIWVGFFHKATQANKLLQHKSPIGLPCKITISYREIAAIFGRNFP